MKILASFIFVLIIATFTLCIYTKEDFKNEHHPKFEVEDSDDLFALPFYANEYTRDSFGCINFIDMEQHREIELCGTYKIEKLKY